MKKILILIALTLFLLKMANSQELPTRDQVADNYKWNLADLYKTNADFEKDFKEVNEMATKFVSHQGNLTKNAKNLLTATKDYNEIWRRFSRLYMFVSLQADADVSDSKNQILETKVRNLGSEIDTKLAFYSPEILSVSLDVIKKYIKEEADLSTYNFYFEKMFRMKEHTLSTEGEEIIAAMGPVLSIPGKIYGVLNDVELQLPKVQGENGKDMEQVSHGRYRAALYSIDRAYRERVYKGIYEGYKANLDAFEALYNGRVSSRIAMANIRKFSSALDAAVYTNDVPASVYHNLVESVQKNAKTLHRWAEIKRKALKLDKLHPYDTYVTLFEEEPKTYTYEEGVSMVREALKPLGEKYIQAFDLAINSRWIDVYETKNKRSGAYSNGCGCGIHPWVLLNWTGTLDDVFTLAHEMGHNMHSYFTEEMQPYHYTDYSIFVAEVASTTNEALLQDYLVKSAKTKKEKMALLEKFLTNAQATFFRQARFAEFEMLVHEKAEKGQYLSAEELSKLFAERYQYYWGNSMITDIEEGYSWARVHHLTQYNFYVYQYATSFAAAQLISQDMIEKGQPAIDKYLAFLGAGSSDKPINVLKIAGVDMSTPEPITKTIEKMEKYMDEMEKLMNE